MSEREGSRGAMRVAFGAWMTIIVAGLAIMIALPLLGR